MEDDDDVIVLKRKRCADPPDSLSLIPVELDRPKRNRQHLVYALASRGEKRKNVVTSVQKRQKTDPVFRQIGRNVVEMHEEWIVGPHVAPRETLDSADEWVYDTYRRSKGVTIDAKMPRIVFDGEFGRPAEVSLIQVDDDEDLDAVEHDYPAHEDESSDDGVEQTRAMLSALMMEEHNASDDELFGQREVMCPSTFPKEFYYGDYGGAGRGEEEPVYDDGENEEGGYAFDELPNM